MDEQEFDALFHRPFEREDVFRADAQLRRCTTLATALCGRTPEDLQRQLLARHPEIPVGFTLADFRELRQFAQRIAARLRNPRHAWASPQPSRILVVGTQRYTEWEARCEIIRRTVEHLENR